MKTEKKIYSEIVKMDMIMGTLAGMMYKHKTTYGACVYTFSMPTTDKTDVATYFELQQNPDASWQIVQVNVKNQARPMVTWFDHYDLDKAIDQCTAMIQQAFVNACHDDSYIYACRYSTLQFHFNSIRALVTKYATTD